MIEYNPDGTLKRVVTDEKIYELGLVHPTEPEPVKHPDNSKYYRRVDPKGLRRTEASTRDLMEDSDGNPVDVEEHLATADPSAANLVSSAAKGDLEGIHYPCIDLDGIEVRLVESSNPGNAHLYIDQPCTWDNYELLLHALYRCGIISRGYLDFSTQRRRTHLRLRPDKNRPSTQAFPPMASVGYDGFTMDDGKTDVEIELDNIDQALEAL